jgi:hypothetical protein
MRHSQILALTSDGMPHQWLPWETAISMKYKGLVSFELGDEDKFMGGISRMTGEQSHIEIGSIIGIKGKFKHSSKTPVLTNQNLFRRDNLICSYCGKHFSEAHLTRDHIVPVSRGGKDIWTNVVAACWKCNNKKGNMMLDDCGLELLWVPYTPSRYETLILQNRNILFDQAQYVAQFLPKHSRVPDYLKRHCGIVLS